MEEEGENSKKQTEPVKKQKGIIRRHPFIFVYTILIIIILLITSGAKLWLYVQFLLGNDTLLQLSSDKHEIFLSNGEEEKVTFSVNIRYNLFCKASCTYKFEDLSSGELIDENNFTLLSSVPLAKQYSIKQNKMMVGQDYYRFSIECISKKTAFCDTKEEKTIRNNLVIINYNWSETDKEYVDELKSKLNNLSYEISILEKNSKIFKEILSKANEKILIEISENKTDRFSSSLKEDKEILENIDEQWNNQDFDSVENEIKTLKEFVINTREEFINLNQTIIQPVYEYNNLIDRLNRTRENIINISKNYDLNESENSQFNVLISEFGDAVEKFSAKNSIENKSVIVFEIEEKIDEFKPETISEPANSGSLHTIPEITSGKIYPENVSVEQFVFDEPNPMCCVFQKCYKCCVDKTCKNINYPILILHGHSFYEELSAEFHFDVFNNMQKKLEQDNYLDVGIISMYNNYSYSFQKIPVPLTIKSSYYYDVLKQEDNFIVQTRSESIDSYATRLKDIIQYTKEKTGKEKITIVAHSMGGLAIRRYIQLFGNGDIDKVILIAVPNNGIEGNVADYCSVFGGDLECEDMKKGSLFLKRLNIAGMSYPRIYNIIGDGCNMEVKLGDGVVTKENAYLNGAENYYINGTCKGVTKIFHTEMLDVKEYPEMYEMINRILNSD
jgi:hypothetical protein